MTNLEKYKQPGVLEDYCLGLLPETEAAEIFAALTHHPDLLERVMEIEHSLIAYSADSRAIPLKEKILQALDQLPLSSQIDLNNPPVLTRSSEWQQWNEAVRDLLPDNEFGALKVRFIKESPEIQLCVAWLSGILEEPEHYAGEFAESFLILEGTCECNIGGQRINLKAGDYLDIPFNTPHSIRSTSGGPGFVKALLQRRRLAA